MWIQANPNPKNKNVVDCVIRAVSIILGLDWYTVYDALCITGREDCNMPSSDDVWGHFLLQLGFRPFLLPESCPECVTVKEFCHIFTYGRYIIGTGYHAVAIINGNYYDSWDSGNEVPTFFWKIE